MSEAECTIKVVCDTSAHQCGSGNARRRNKPKGESPGPIKSSTAVRQVCFEYLIELSLPARQGDLCARFVYHVVPRPYHYLGTETLITY